jgi:hypothetical protein
MTGIADARTDLAVTGLGGDAGSAGRRSDAAGLGGGASAGTKGDAGFGGGGTSGVGGAGGTGGAAAGSNAGTTGTAGASGGASAASGAGGAAAASGGSGGTSGGAAGIGPDGGAGAGGRGGARTGGTGGGAGLGGMGGSSGQGGTPAVVISVDFVGGGTAMAATEVAGVVRAARWNSAALASGSLTSLMASTGATTTAAVSWNGENVYQLGIPDAAGDARMMNGYLDPFGMATVTITGLPTSLTTRGYDVYVYANGDVPTGQTRSGSYVVAGMTMTLVQAANTSYAGTHTQAVGGGGGTYLVFRGLRTPSFTLSATPGPATGAPRSPLNGFQIVALP